MVIFLLILIMASVSMLNHSLSVADSKADKEEGGQHK